MSLVTDAFANLEIAVLPFPFVQVVADFRRDMERVLSRGNKKIEVPPPYRQLNNALVACASTLTYGFEYVGYDQESNSSLYQALAVGTPENPLKTPTLQQIHELVRIWAQEWTKKYRDKGKPDEVNSVCDRFLERMGVIPPDWDWQRIKPETLVRDINAEKGLGFQAIPSLLATMLHDIPAPSGIKAPLAMRDYEFISRPRKKRQPYQQIAINGIYRALQGKAMHIFLIY
jgi:hypothetical protein